ncbi:fumarylacetoacetate hydrolase family protein [Pusillimonas sp.]|uniref:fumarylacetoacetate hydrolase family protein n=1 Tax=Pusillimonas sp. TaxID=3040095 RepID=UPI0037C8034F
MGWIGLGTYDDGAGLKPAVVVEEKLYDLEQAVKAGAPSVKQEWLAPDGVKAMLTNWNEARKWIEEAEPIVMQKVAEGAMVPLSGEVRVAPPYVPQRIFCAASNYAEHASEMGTELAAKAQSKPYMFLKLSNTVIGNGDTILMPPETQMLDWEIELAAVIGKRGRRISVDDALDHIAGYTVINDISARDLNVRSDYPFKHDWFQGKCHDTFAPIGPWIVPAWHIPEPQAVHMRLDVNGEPMQEDTTANMIWTVREQIAYLSTIVTLEPGDVIATGTPTGVGMGRGVYLKAGDRLVARIEGIGSLANVVRAETM